MQQVPGSGKESDKPVPLMLVHLVEHLEIQKVHKRPLHHEKNKGRQMKIKRVESPAKPIVDGGRCRHDRAVCLIGGKGCGSRAVQEKGWDVADIPDVNIVDYGMGIVKVEAILKMIRVGHDYGERQDRC